MLFRTELNFGKGSWGENRAMKVYEVEYRAVITLAALDMQKAALQGAAVIKHNPNLFHLRAVHERISQPASAEGDHAHLTFINDVFCAFES
jgi:hypothetical protein